MIVTHKIKMDLAGCTVAPCLDVMQDDRYSRDLEISLFSGPAEFLPPEDCAALIRYRKADGRGGIYDTMPDGTQAWRISGNTVTVSLAPQVCTVPGDVAMTVSLIKDDAQLSCFEIRLRVRKCPHGHFESRQYLNVTRFLPQPENAEAGKFLRVTQVDGSGRITGMETADLPGGAFVIHLSGSEEAPQADKTLAQMQEAYDAGSSMYCVFGEFVMDLATRASEDQWTFVGTAVVEGLVVICYTVFSGDTIGLGLEPLMPYSQMPTVPSTLPNPNSLIFTGAVSASYNGSSQVTVEIPDGADAIPSYVTREAERVAGVVQEHQNADTITFLACSDLHYSESVSNAAQQLKTLTHCGQALGLLRELVHVDFAAMLGDMVWDSGETTAAAMEAMRTVNSHLSAGFAGIPNFRARGNHDCLYSDSTGLTDNQIFANIGAFNAGAEYDSANRLGGYCYRDFPDRKLRVICINTSESSSGEFNVSSAQISWLQTALDLSGLGEGWQSIVLGHHPPDWTGSSNALVQTLKTAEGLLCVFHGHVHCFRMDTIPNTAITRIAIPNVCYGRENEYGKNGIAENSEGTEFGESITYSKLSSGVSETSFCVVTIDLQQQKVYADHYGAGYDRVAALGETVSYSVSYDLTKVTSSNVGITAVEGSQYTTELTFVEGYALNSVSITMGGEDITASAFRGGRISIASVTGDVVITAKAAALSGGFTNLVPTSLGSDGSVYNAVGYQDNSYVSTESPYWKTATDGSVTTGLLAYKVYGADNTTYYQPPAIYIRGALFAASDSRNRLGLFTSDLVCVTCPYGDTLLTYFDLEELGVLYYKLTPKMNAAGQNLMAAAGFKPSVYLALTVNGLGRNLIVTLDEEIA